MHDSSYNKETERVKMEDCGSVSYSGRETWWMLRREIEINQKITTNCSNIILNLSKHITKLEMCPSDCIYINSILLSLYNGCMYKGYISCCQPEFPSVVSHFHVELDPHQEALHPGSKHASLVLFPFPLCLLLCRLYFLTVLDFL